MPPHSGIHMSRIGVAIDKVCIGSLAMVTGPSISKPCNN